MTGRGDLTEAEWRRLEPFLPVGNNRCGRWRNHRQVVNGILHRVRTGVQWRACPNAMGRGRPSMSAIGAGQPTGPGSGCSSRCRPGPMLPAGSTGTFRSTPPRSVPTSNGQAATF
ncbi:transposase [Streptomyces sp. NPDC055287]